MGRTYIRKKPKRSEKLLTDAMAAVRHGELSTKAASRTYGVPRSTLVLHLKGWNVKSGSVRKPPKHKFAGSPRCLSEKDEETIAMCVKLMGKWGFGISRLELFDLVQEYVVSNAIHTRFKNGKPGEDWYLGFMKRQGLSLKKPEKLETSRMKQTDPFIVDEFFDLLSEEITNKGLQDKPGSIFNCDETSFCHDPSNTKVISPRGQPCKRQTAGTGRLNTTVLATVAADGSKFPPFIVFKGKKMWENWMSKDAYAGTAYAVSDRGWMTETVFLNWFQHQFIDRVKLIEGPKILIHDGHISHVSISLIDCAVKNDTTLLKLPPHTTHFLQPLDVSGFKPVKTKWDKVLVEWQRHNYGRTLGKSDFSKLLGEAWPALSEQNIKAGFKKTGIFPIDKAAVSTEHYSAAQLYRFKAFKQSANIDEPASDSNPTTTVSMHSQTAPEPQPSTSGSAGNRCSSTPMPTPVKRAVAFENLIIEKLRKDDRPTAETVKRRQVRTSAEVITREDYIKRMHKENKKERESEEEEDIEPDDIDEQQSSPPNDPQPKKKAARPLNASGKGKMSVRKQNKQLVELKEALQKAKEDIKKDQYYAVFYDVSLYIGRILDDDLPHGKVRLKFLKTKSVADKSFEWPRKDDITSVNRNFIIAGPLSLQGAGPFTVDNMNTVSQLYKQVKLFKDKLFANKSDTDSDS